MAPWKETSVFRCALLFFVLVCAVLSFLPHIWWPLLPRRAHEHQSYQPGELISEFSGFYCGFTGYLDQEGNKVRQRRRCKRSYVFVRLCHRGLRTALLGIFLSKNVKMSTVIVVHGGAWAIPDELAEASVDGVKAAACEGFSVLRSRGSALDAVEAAVRTMEDNSVFDAGRGATLNTDGEVELDAIIMDGGTLASGAVSCVKNIANPVSLARAVMEKTAHTMLTGRGANLFAEKIGIGTVPTDSLVTDYERKEWEKHKDYFTGVMEEFNSQWAHDTVGAVAVDCTGDVACATSTGGIRNKMVGRVGDSPIVGSGGFADNFSGAVSCTGHGESILKVTLARLILLHIEQGKSVGDASQLSLQYMAQRVRGAGGAVVVSPSGQWAATFTTERMAWAAVENDVLWYGLNPEERLKEQLS